MSTTDGRRAIHTYVEPRTHAQWHNAARRRRLTVSAIIEALGPEIDKILDVVNLHAPHDRIVRSFSGGQQARLLLVPYDTKHVTSSE